MITILDIYEGSEVLYCGGSIREAKRAIKQRIEDTAGECALDYTIENTPSVKEKMETIISDYIETITDEFFKEVNK